MSENFGEFVPPAQLKIETKALASEKREEHNLVNKPRNPNGESVETSKEMPKTWDGVFDTQTGEEFRNAMRGIGLDGKQDVTRNRITTDYSMREFVRRNPNEARHYMDLFQTEHGRQHPDLAKAIEQVEELEENPITIPPESSEYQALAYQMDQDEKFQKTRDELSIAHKMKVFGTTDFSTIPLERFMDIASSDANMSFSADREAEKRFRQDNPDLAALYDKREQTRVYRDPDGMINRNRDPSFLKMFEPNDRGVAWTREEGLRRFAMNYPEKARAYAQQYPDLAPYIKKSTEANSDNSPVVTEKVEVAEDKSESTVNQLSTTLQAEGIDTRVVNVPNAGEFSEVITLPKKETPSEQTLRLYRGVRQLDASVVNQAPYAMRADTEDGLGQKILSEVEAEVVSLTDEPTYDRLIAYIEKVKPHLTPQQQERMDRELRQIEDGVLKGYSLRTELKYSQIGHNGGVLDSGISPYLSASWDPEQALGYAGEDGAVLVIDVPISKIEDFREDGSETNIKGTLSPEDVSAIVISNGRTERNKQTRSSLFSTAIGAVNDSIQTSRYQESEVANIRKGQIDAAKEFDEQQRQLDVQAIRQKRANELVTQFPEVGVSFDDSQESDGSPDYYGQAQARIFDFYSQKLDGLGRSVNDLSYESETEYGARKPFDRNSLSDEMLYQLRLIVQRLEQRITTPS